eukprot:9091527-Pyramimonas_sp.AAC.1
MPTPTPRDHVVDGAATRAVESLFTTKRVERYEAVILHQVHQREPSIVDGWNIMARASVAYPWEMRGHMSVGVQREDQGSASRDLADGLAAYLPERFPQGPMGATKSVRTSALG